MNKVLFSQPFETNGNTAYNFYREGIGFGQIEAVPVEGGGRVAEVSFDDEDVAVHPLSDISLEEGDWRDGSKPVADIESIETAERFISLALNNIIDSRRAKLTRIIEAGYGDRLRKPRIRRACDRKLDEQLADPRYTYSQVSDSH